VNIFKHDVSVIVCMLINFNTTMLKKFKEDHTVVQKVMKVEIAKIFIVMTHSNNSMHMFNNDEQLQLMKEDIKNNCFAHYINRNLFKHLIMLEYFHMLLTEQYRAIFIIDDIVFTVWYKVQMQFSVNSSLQLNMTITIIILKSFCKIDLIWFILYTFVTLILNRFMRNTMLYVLNKQNSLRKKIARRLHSDYTSSKQ